MEEDISPVLERLALRQLDRLLFEGQPNDWPNRHVFGGHIIAQAIDAAIQTVDPRYKVHGLHSYFLRPGNAERSVIYDVDPIRDGRSFCTRRVVAIQNGEAIFSCSISFHVGEDGVTHQPEMPDVPQPEDLENDEAYYGRILKAFQAANRKRPIMPFDMRAIDRMDIENPQPKSSLTGYWLKLKNTLDSDDFHRHCALLAYCSDFSFLSSNLRPHAMIPRDPRLKTVASLDHAMWFHNRDFRVDDWIFYQTEGYWTGSGRGLARGTLFARDGKLIATTTQESLLRLDHNNEDVAKMLE